MLSSKCEKVLGPISGETRLRKPKELQFCRLKAPNSLGEQTEDVQSAELVETKITRDKHDAQSMLGSHQILAACNQVVEVSLGVEGNWRLSLEILDTDA